MRHKQEENTEIDITEKTSELNKWARTGNNGRPLY
jgi:hypothetical protein